MPCCVFPNLSCIKNKGCTGYFVQQEKKILYAYRFRSQIMRNDHPAFFFFFCVSVNIQIHTHIRLHCVQWILQTNNCSLRALASAKVVYRDSFSVVVHFKKIKKKKKKKNTCTVISAFKFLT